MQFYCLNSQLMWIFTHSTYMQWLDVCLFSVFFITLIILLNQHIDFLKYQNNKMYYPVQYFHVKSFCSTTHLSYILIYSLLFNIVKKLQCRLFQYKITTLICIFRTILYLCLDFNGMIPIQIYVKILWVMPNCTLTAYFVWYS